MSIQRPTPWSSILQFDNKTWTNINRRIIIMDKLEHWLEFNCFHRLGNIPKFKFVDAWNLSMVPTDTRIVLLIIFSSGQY